MTRVALTVLLPLVLPSVLYLLWVFSVGRGTAAGSAQAWGAVPWTWLGLAGAMLAALVLFAIAQFSGQRVGTYVPPHVRDGRIVAGHVVPVAPTER